MRPAAPEQVDSGSVELSLRTPRSAVAFDLADGARQTSLSFDGHELLVPREDRDTLWWGSFVMAPWTGDLVDGAFDWHGVEQRVPCAPGASASHGTARLQRWRRTGPASASAVLGPEWPFAGSVEMSAVLDETSLTTRLVLRAEEEMPAALGIHPWFARRLSPTGGEAQVHLVPGTTMLVRDEAGLPTTDFTALAPPPWNETVRCPTPLATVHWPGDGMLTISWTSSLATVFTAHPQGVCVEPVTSPSGRMDHSLAAGDSLELAVTMAWTPETTTMRPRNGVR